MISIKDNKIRWTISAVLALLILFGTYRNVFSLAAFLLMGLMLVFCDRESNLLQIFFVMPMANIFKLSPGVQSFFTIIILAYVVLHLALPRRATLLVILFALYVLIGELWGGQFNLFRTVKLICNLLFLSSTLNGKVKVEHKELFFSYIIGNIVASVFGTMDSSLFKIHSYIGLKELGGVYEQGEEIYRFAGLYEDPNYYSIGLILSICLLIVINHNKEIKTGTMFLFAAPLLYFAAMTYSKSALIMLLVPFAFLIYSQLSQKKYIAVCLLLIVVMLIICLVLSGQIPTLEIVLERLSAGETAEGVDINKLTTGRFDLWIMYAKYIIKNIKVGLFGVGISSSILNKSAAHNTYLDIFYYLGAFGGILLVLSLVSISAQNRRSVFKRSPLNYSVIICIIIMYFFLSELFYHDPPFHIFLAFTVLNLPFESNVTKNELEMVKENEYVRIQKTAEGTDGNHG